MASDSVGDVAVVMFSPFDYLLNGKF